MTRRKARIGKNVGNPYWGCPSYPDGKTMLPAETQKQRQT